MQKYFIGALSWTHNMNEANEKWRGNEKRWMNAGDTTVYCPVMNVLWWGREGAAAYCWNYSDDGVKSNWLFQAEMNNDKNQLVVPRPFSSARQERSEKLKPTIMCVNNWKKYWRIKIKMRKCPDNRTNGFGGTMRTLLMMGNVRQYFVCWVESAKLLVSAY